VVLRTGEPPSPKTILSSSTKKEGAIAKLFGSGFGSSARYIESIADTAITPRPKPSIRSGLECEWFFGRKSDQHAGGHHQPRGKETKRQAPEPDHRLLVSDVNDQRAGGERESCD
jgi:hypothetical protein